MDTVTLVILAAISWRFNFLKNKYISVLQQPAKIHFINVYGRKLKIVNLEMIEFGSKLANHKNTGS